MKVNGVNNILFRSNNSDNTVSNILPQKNEKHVRELSYVTPDFNVKTPVKYKNTGVYSLENGLNVYTYKLDNGYKVSIVPMEGSPAVAKTYVNVGSLNETQDIKGISHFLEHMAFNGTNGDNGHIKLNTGDSFKMIDKIGGWANASTNYAITDYVNSAPLLDDKDLEVQIKVLAAMAEDLKLSDDMIKKEKGPVSSEINMIMDDPQTIALDQTVRSLFNIKNPADELVGGSVSHIQNLTKKDVMNYYNTYYTPNNTNIVITGDINPDETIKLIAKNFNSRKAAQGKKFEEKIVPINKTVRKDFVSDKATSAEIVLGFTGPTNNNTKEKILFNIAHAYMDSQESELSKNLKKYNSSYIIDSQKISTNLNNPRMTYLGTSVSEQNCEQLIAEIFNTIANIKPVSQETAKRLKQKIRLSNENSMEYSESVNSYIGMAMLNNDMDYITKYNDILDTITPQEIDEAIKKYFDITKTAITVVHPQIQNNNVSFKGSRKPLNSNKIINSQTANNYDLAFYDTKTNKFDLNLQIYTETPYIEKPGVIDVLNEIYSMGTFGSSEDEFDNFLDKHNLKIGLNSDSFGFNAYLSGDMRNYKLGLQKLKELLYNPNITEENLKTAVNTIKDAYERQKNSAYSVYTNFNASTLPYAYTDEEKLNSLDNITVNDLIQAHKALFANASGIIAANLPAADKNNIKNNIINFAENLEKVKPNKYKKFNYYKPVEKSVVLTKPNNNSQADIMEVFKFNAGDDIKEIVTGKIMNSILSSSSIGLFDVLREKENLAYSVFSDILYTDDIGELSLNILTTTDNKTIGEYSYDNVQKSINGFNRQIGELTDGKFTEQDLENAKRSMKANLLNMEGNSAKLFALTQGLNSKYGINYRNIMFETIDKISKDDVISYAKKVFANKPVYSIVASQDTLDANKDFFKNLESK